MLRKQYTWGSSEVLLTVLLFLTFQCFSADPGLMSAGESSSGSTLDWRYQSVLDAAPDDIRYLPDILRDPERCEAYEHRYLALVGKPGVGKSTLAQAVAASSQWKTVPIPTSNVLRGQRNEAQTRLDNLFSHAKISRLKTLFIFEEFNKLVEHFDDTKYDSDATAACIWQFFDDQKVLPNIFSIVVMNSIEDNPDQIKQRLSDSWFTITDLHNQKVINNIIDYTLTRISNITIDDETKKYAVLSLNELGITSPRLIENKAVAIRNQAMLKSKLPVNITKFHVNTIIERSRINDPLLKLGHKKENESKQFHRESMEMQQKNHQESIALTKELSERQLEQNRQLSQMQLAQNERLADRQLYLSAGTFIVQSLLTGYQIHSNQLLTREGLAIQRVMKNLAKKQFDTMVQQFSETKQMNVQQLENMNQNAESQRQLSEDQFSEQMAFQEEQKEHSRSWPTWAWDSAKGLVVPVATGVVYVVGYVVYETVTK